MLYITVVFLILLLSPAAYYANASRSLPTGSKEYVRAPYYQNSNKCGTTVVSNHHSPGCQCDPSFIHVAMTLDSVYLRGSVAAVNSILKHTACPRSIYFHFLAAGKSGSGVRSETDRLSRILRATFPYLAFRVYPFAEQRVKRLISSSVRQALDSPLNYARTYLADIISPCVERIIYLDSDLVLVDDIQKLWSIKLGDSKVIGAPQYCHANFTRYFTDEFWSDPELNKNFEGKQPCYFNTGVMIIELQRWRKGGFTKKIENWMKIQKERRIYELGSLPPFLLVFGGDIEPIHHRWNQHGLGGDNLVNSCRSLHPGPVSLLHWSGKGKPWVRLDQGTMCPVDHLWAPYDLHRNRLRPQ